VVQRLPSMCEALGSIPAPKKKKKRQKQKTNKKTSMYQVHPTTYRRVLMDKH
jgi:hypothetical protein